MILLRPPGQGCYQQAQAQAQGLGGHDAVNPFVSGTRDWAKQSGDPIARARRISGVRRGQLLPYGVTR